MTSVVKINDSERRLNAALKELHSRIFNIEGGMNPEYLENTKCPICSSESSKNYCVKDNFRHVECCSCGMVYINPRLNGKATLEFYNSVANEIYNEQKFNAFSAGDSIDDKINKRNAQLIADSLSGSSKAVNPLLGKKLLEIGCAKGYFLNSAQNLGAEVFGVELNKANAEIARLSHGENIFDRDLFELNLPGEMFDVVYMRDVIEHIHNPIPFLEELTRLMKIGGMIFIETHNVDGLIHRLVGGRHTCLFGFEHPVHWSPKTLKFALSKCGIKIQKVHFESLDFNVLTILNYFRASTWTTISPWRSGPIVTFILKFLSIPFRIRQVDLVSSYFMKLLANYLGLGSTMKVVGLKSEGEK